MILFNLIPDLKFLQKFPNPPNPSQFLPIIIIIQIPIMPNIVTTIILTLTLLITLSYSVSPIDPSTCTNYYSQANPPPPCVNSTTCYFMFGFQNLVVNKTAATFVLCLDLPGYNIYVNYTNTTDVYIEQIQALYVYTSNLYLLANYSLLCQSNLVIYTQSMASFQQVTLAGSRLYIISEQNLLINGSNFINESIIPTQCSCSNQKKCNWTFEYPQLFNSNDQFNISQYFQAYNYTIPPGNSATFIAQNSISISDTIIKYSIIGIFSSALVVNGSTISASGLGYASDSGPGCGYFDQVLNQLLGCMGSGGSHGGFGGNSSPQNCYLLVSRQPYDSLAYPKEPGSGGGFFLPHSRQSSSGGGVINIQGQNLNFISTIIAAQGKNGIQGGGGGAGGTISLDYNKIYSSSALITANGGNGDRLSSSGSGGRIRLWNHMWKQENQTNVNMTITVAGGSGCTLNQNNFMIQLSCGESGSVFTSPCRPGSQLQIPSYICTPCAQGKYQLTYGYSPCVSCTPKPPNSSWLSQPNTSQILFYQNSCTYICNESGGYYAFEGQCLTNSQIWEIKLYAKNVYICLGMIGAAVVIYVVIVGIKKLAQQDSILGFDDPGLNQAYRKKFFRLEELPYHQMRLYLSGQNHPFNPWKITQQAQTNLYSQLKSPITRITPILSKITASINKKGQYSKMQKLVITCLRYTYYPLSRIVLASMRKQKAREIFEEVDKFNKKIPEVDNLGVKFHVKSQQTVGSLEIFNYSKSVLDFYIENYFPLYVLLEKAPYDGYIIDFSDPFFKVFINEIVQKQSTGKSIEIFLKQTNKFLKNPAQVLSCLNHLWTLSDINSKFQAFLWQPTNKILGIDRQYKIDKSQPLFLVFTSQNLNGSHFLLNQSLPSTYLPELECLRHKFIIRKDLASQEEGNSLCMINNQFNQKTLFWVFGIFTTVFLLLSVAALFLSVFIISELPGCDAKGWNSFNYGFTLYFALWPLCDFTGAFLNYKTILSKSQYILADSISFNIFSMIKSLILFISSLIKLKQTSSAEKSCLQANQYIWLTMVVAGVVIFVIQVLLRAKIITHGK